MTTSPFTVNVPPASPIGAPDVGTDSQLSTGSIAREGVLLASDMMAHNRDGYACAALPSSRLVSLLNLQSSIAMTSEQPNERLHMMALWMHQLARMQEMMSLLMDYDKVPVSLALTSTSMI